MTDRLPAWRATAQANADLADAVHAQSASLCIYLLEMREFYRWERRLPFDHALSRSEIGPWITAREAGWDRLRDSVSGELAFAPLLPELEADPFATESIREVLAGEGLAYGAGIGRFGRPQFFLARLLDRQVREGCEILVCGEELARGASAPPALSRGREVLIRQDALDRWLWSRYEEWRLHPRDNGLAAAYAIHEAALPPGERDAPSVVRRMAAHEREALILHELGERQVDAQLGEHWHDLIEDAPSRKAEVLARAVRDLLADCAVTLPTLIARDDDASIHCWFGLLDGMRLKLAPGMMEEYQRWRRCTGTWASLPALVDSARCHWADVARTLLDAWQAEGSTALDRLVDDESLSFGARQA
jgi:hypothetical protein